jgi:hypothetical protein
MPHALFVVRCATSSILYSVVSLFFVLCSLFFVLCSLFFYAPYGTQIFLICVA